MRRNRSLRSISVVFSLLVIAATAASAEEIVHLTNGAAMPVRGHEIIDDMIHVDLGGNALMAFPMDQVERITAAGKDVYLPESFSPANVAAESRSGVRVGSARGIRTGAPVSGRDGQNVSASQRRQMARASSIEEVMATAAMASSGPVEPGLARALPGVTNSRARSMRVAGRADAWGGAAVGTGAVGNLRQTVNGESKLVIPKYAGAGGQSTEVRRFLPSAKAASAAVAQGKPLNVPTTQTQPPPSQGSNGGGSGSDQ